MLILQVTIYTDFMAVKQKILIPLILIIIGCSCSRNNDKNNINNLLITSLEYILANEDLPKEYRNQPLQIVQYKKDSIVKPLKVNGKECIILAEQTDVYKMLNGMDLFKPIPVVEIIKVNFFKEFIIVDLIFRATGHAFEVKVEKKNNGYFKVISMKTSTV